ncbi:MAG: hypothetical protein JSS51_09650 [Planctomycetes bacterium]|nr:hypothetical protein [Planctomycetota bacterium]
MTNTFEEIAGKMVCAVPESINGYACIVVGNGESDLQGYELRPLNGGDAFAERAADEIKQWIAEAIKQACTAERAKFAAFADEKGEPLKTLRPLCHTKDGVIVQDGDWVSWHEMSFQVYEGRIPIAREVCGGWEDIPASECYSTAEAERAALKGGA